MHDSRETSWKSNPEVEQKAVKIGGIHQPKFSIVPAILHRRIYGRGTGRQDSRAGCFPRAGLSQIWIRLCYSFHENMWSAWIAVQVWYNTEWCHKWSTKNRQEFARCFCNEYCCMFATVVTFWHSSSKAYDRFFELAPAGQEYFKQSATRNLADTKEISKT